ncbi:MAG: lasso peptide [Kaiparowitsia implicata GSE-PSE-MK54-09C]|jgi:hypothetical protein|nr:lasso peptide [Kaiparowitsia implicata GSE-PSE-MK54-09C]
MKKSYIAPQLTNHGSVESLTQAVGDVSFSDTVFLSASVNPVAIGDSAGSRDAIVVPL